MEMALHANGPVYYCRGAFPAGSLCFRSRPGLRPLSQSPTCCKDVPRIKVAPQMAASSEYPKRRFRRSLTPKTKGSTPKGFAPRPQLGTSMEKKNQEEQEEGAAISISSEQTTPDTNRTEVSSMVRQSPDLLEEIEEENMGTKYMQGISSASSTMKHSDHIESVEVEKNDVDRKKDEEEIEVENMGTKYMEGVSSIKSTIKHSDHIDSDEVGEDDADGKKHEIISRTEHMTGEKQAIVNSQMDITELGRSPKKEVGTDGMHAMQVAASRPSFSSSLDKIEAAKTEAVQEAAVDIDDQLDKMSPKGNHPISDDGDEHIIENKDLDDIYVTEMPDVDESLIKQKMEIDQQAQRQMLRELTEENLSQGNKIFVFPQVPKSDQIVQVFLNRSMSTLMNESDIFIMGAFNDWKWKSFTEKLQKFDLNGDWWSCQIHVPKEAYKMDFVFFNGGHVYENNDTKDFHITIEGEMDASAFEDFMLEEKRRELEKLAQEQAERERRAEEQRQEEEEKAGREADKAQAKMEIEKRRQALHHVMKQAVASVDSLWYIKPNVFKGEDKVRLFYNRSSRPLAHATEIWIHGGYNNWRDGPSIAERLFRAEKRDGDWWYADVVIPDRALVLDWVFADGPPQNAKVYDNNDQKDFHSIVPNCISEELYWVEEEQWIYRKLREERKMKQEVVSKKAEKAARMKAETKARTMRNFLLAQKHIVYTEPLEVQAGRAVTVFYNPSSTVLNGKPDIWFRCSFNRWTHPAGPLPPQKMVPAENGLHVKATG